jgi:hypothetical protein
MEGVQDGFGCLGPVEDGSHLLGVFAVVLTCHGSVTVTPPAAHDKT